jgi:TPR repeat protein
MPLSKQANAKHAAKKRTEANAKKGIINAQFNLAFLYLHGEGCKVNHLEARDWFEEAANHGDADAQFNLGIMLKEAGDAAAAQRWFQEAGAKETSGHNTISISCREEVERQASVPRKCKQNSYSTTAKKRGQEVLE